MSKPLDLIGKKFGKLHPIERLENNKNGQSRWLCKCECGNEKAILGTSLKSGNTSSCGCIRIKDLIKRSLTHGLSIGPDGKKTRLYNIWIRMRQRCNDINCTDFPDYGGRGIKICQSWNSFKSFHDWSYSHGYSDKLSIDREDVNGHYEPTNCKWATPKEQARNKRGNHFFSFRGETKTLAEWAEITGIESSLLRYRIKNGWSKNEILKQPRKNSKYNVQL